MLPPGRRRDQFVERLLGGLSGFIEESNKTSFVNQLQGGFGGAFGH
jgi:hypothetical protein